MCKSLNYQGTLVRSVPCFQEKEKRGNEKKLKQDFITKKGYNFSSHLLPFSHLYVIFFMLSFSCYQSYGILFIIIFTYVMNFMIPFFVFYVLISVITFLLLFFVLIYSVFIFPEDVTLHIV
jgi:hypothetical protein